MAEVLVAVEAVEGAVLLVLPPGSGWIFCFFRDFSKAHNLEPTTLISDYLNLFGATVTHIENLDPQLLTTVSHFRGF